MLALLSPYAAALYPTALRASGSGLAAAATKMGGMAGPLLVAHAIGVPSLAMWAFIPMAVGVSTLWTLGPKVKGQSLSERVILNTEPEPETV
jgi:putative MFS transporter